MDYRRIEERLMKVLMVASTALILLTLILIVGAVEIDAAG